MIKIDIKNCTACGACIQKCPVSCIKFTNSREGFAYPDVDSDKCIKCGLCNKVCPIADNNSLRIEPKEAYACSNKNEDMLLSETSGGVFGAIATYVLRRKGVVYGCAYINHLQATHIRVDNEDSLQSIFGSKYVQSDTAETFRNCENDLKNGKQVLYSGTPCQIAGLKKYLQKEYENLITVDIICHGVASQSYFDKFIGLLEDAERSTCIDYDFRSKKNAGWSCAGVATFRAGNGKEYSKKQYYFSNYYYYYYYYLACSIYRESCYACEYANLKRIGDFTLGDFWGAEGLDIPFQTEKGCSLVLVNTEKAIALFGDLNLNKYSVAIDIATKYNKQLFEPSKPLLDKKELFREYREETAKTIQKRFKTKNRKNIFKARIKYLVPISLKKKLLRKRYKDSYNLK